MHILYIVYWGACEPLGQSLVVPAVEQMAYKGVRITLITFEKTTDLKNKDLFNQVQQRFATVGIRWIPLKYHKRPTIPAKIFDLLQGCIRSIIIRLDTRYDIIHARTFFGGLIGSILASLLRIRWLYHNEGFYPDEQVDSGVWIENSRIHRFARILEQRMYNAANGLVVLSQKAASIVKQFPQVKCQKTPVVVVPSCVDLNLFKPTRFSIKKTPPLKLVYSGTIGGHRYLFANMTRFTKIAKQVFGAVHLRVLTKTDATLVRELMQSTEFSEKDCSISAVPHTEMPSELVGNHAGIFFLANGLSEHGVSPTKVGEYWASGLPIVVTPNMSDLDEIIQERKVGCIVPEHSDDSYLRSARRLHELILDPEISNRCRKTAEQYYSLESGINKQLVLYNAILNSRKPLDQEF